jgi:Collagen triple helix repeat (20 copies)
MIVEFTPLAIVDAGPLFTTLEALGPVGPKGAPGPQGLAGLPGVPGVAGAAGSAGPAGAVGLQGLAGPAGAPGPTGPQGLQGFAGTTGPAGTAGTTGPVGPTGPVGAVNGEDARLATSSLGVTPIASGSVSGATRFLLPTPATMTGIIERVDVAVPTAQTAELYVCSVNADGTLNLLSLAPLKLAAGLNLISLDMPVSVGHVVGILCNAGIYFAANAGTAPLWSVTGPITTNTPKIVGGSHRLEFGIKISGEVLGGVHALRNRTTALETDFGQIEQLGVVPDNAATSTTAPGNTWFLPTPSVRTGRIRKFQVASAVAQTAQIVVATLNADGTLTATSSTAVSIAVGVNTLALDIAVSAGQYIGYWAPVGGLRYILSTGLGAVYTSGVVGTNTPKAVAAAGQFSLQFGVIVGSGVNGDVNWLVTRALNPSSADPAGLSGLSGTIPTDATAAFAAARAAHPHPYVPQGVYSVTSLPNSGTGFWGPGRVLLNGKRVLLPTRPQAVSLQLALRAKLLSEIGSGAPLVVIGDSIAQGSGASNQDKHWLSLVTSFANLFGSPQDEPVLTCFAATTLAFYGLTTAGTVSQGSNGPVSASLILAAGASCTFTGTYESIDLFYTQDPGAGTLAFSVNGAAAYKTVACAGPLELDKTTWSATTGASLTSQTASGTYSITASGGPVEITGLMRLGVKAAGAPQRLVTFRAARGGFTFANFTAAPVTSALKQAAYAGSTKPFVIIALGTNDALSVAPTVVKNRALAMIALLKAAGVTRIATLPPARPSTALAFPVGSSYEAAIGALMQAYQEQGVPMISTHAIDFIGEGLTTDGVHPNDTGNDRMAQVVVETLAG